MKMRTSHFGLVNQIDAIAAAGYDCAELHVREIVGFDGAEYKAAVKTLRDSGITAEVFDNPLPLDVIIADDSFDIAVYTEHMKLAVERCAEMGARYFVYGNGKTRKLLDGAEKEKSVEKNEKVLRILCGLAAEANITILIEPLAASICNVWLGIPEIYEYAQKLGVPNIKTLVDYRWLLAGGFTPDIIEKYPDFIRHVHIDNPDRAFPERLVPMADDGHDYAPLFDTLKKICYKGIISFEANTFSDFSTDIRKGLDLLATHGIHPYGKQ